MATLEISVYSVRSAIDAYTSGADRIELCASRSEGGITPSYGLISVVRKVVPIPLFVIIRPRGGDFLYSREDFGVMKEDIKQVKNLGVDGIVTGVLTPEGEIDEERTGALVKAAYPLEVTFHRAFDMVRDPDRALQAVIRTGASRILTAGQASDVITGSDRIKHLVAIAGKQITIMPGGGVHSGNMIRLAEITGTCEFHTSAKQVIPGGMQFKREHVYMGNTAPHNEYQLIEASREEIRKCVENINLLNRKNKDHRL